MTPQEKEVFAKVVSDFSKLKRRKRLGAQAEDKLIQGITALMGIYGFDKSKVLAEQIEKMISFGEKRFWAMQGQRIVFEKLKKGKLKIKRYGSFKRTTRKTKKR
jgi:hypothetical protein